MNPFSLSEVNGKNHVHMVKTLKKVVIFKLHPSFHFRGVPRPGEKISAGCSPENVPDT